MVDVALVEVELVLEELVLERVVPVRLLAKKLVVVAEVPVAREKVKFVRVDEALERKPLLKAMVVEVEFSPVPRVVNGKAKVRAAGNDVRQVPPRQSSVVEAYDEEKSVEEAFEKV